MGSGVYFIFMFVNLACVPIVWFLYPETAGRALEDMDALFGKAKSTDPRNSSADLEPGEDVRLREEPESREEEESSTEGSREEVARLLG